MSTAASAVTTVDSATTAEVATTPAIPAFDATDQKTWSGAQKDHWNKTGTQPTKADSATATDTEKKDKTQPDSSTGKEKTADTASDSATDTEQKRKQRTSEDTERRIGELLDEVKVLNTKLKYAERGKTSDTRDTKQASQPAAEAKPTPLKQFLDEFFAKAENKGKAYEDGVEAWQVVRDAERGKELERNVRAQIAQEAAQKDLNARVAEAEKRYPDYQERIQPAVKAIVDDQQIPFAVKAMLNASPVFTDLIYVLAEPKALADFIRTAKDNPTEAITKIVLTQQLIHAELAKASGKDKAGESADGADKSGDGKTRDASGKFVSSESKDDAASETKPRAPKPPSEVGGRGTASEDALASAAKAGNFKAFEAEQNRRLRASAKA